MAKKKKKKKRCPKCGHDKEFDAFSLNKRRKDGHSSECKACHKKMRKSYYERHKKKEIARVHARKRSIAAWFAELKETLVCVQCGEDRVPCLDFHHDDPDQKEMELSTAVNMGWRKERILAELEKCTVLCCRCHRVLHSRP